LWSGLALTVVVAIVVGVYFAVRAAGSDTRAPSAAVPPTKVSASVATPLVDLGSVGGRISVPGEIDWYEWQVSEFRGSPEPRWWTVASTVDGGCLLSVYGPDSRTTPVTLSTSGPDFTPGHEWPWFFMAGGEFELATYYVEVRAADGSATGDYVISGSHKP
jgi:hypothetical protein